MPWIIDAEGTRLVGCRSDAEAVRWWRANGEEGDRLEDTGELMSEVSWLVGPLEGD